MLEGWAENGEEQVVSTCSSDFPRRGRGDGAASDGSDHEETQGAGTGVTGGGSDGMVVKGWAVEAMFAMR